MWVVLQPYRLTLLHPHGQPLWWLLVEPQLLVILAGAAFSFFVAPGLLDDLEAAEEAIRAIKSGEAGKVIFEIA